MGRERVETARLVLRRPLEQDAAFVLALLADPATTEHNPSDALEDRAGAEALLRRWSSHWDAGLGYWIVERAAGGAIGVCGVRAVELAGLPAWNLLYRFAPDVRGHGFAREAATEAVRTARAVDPARLVVARIRPANVASARVAAAIGLRRRPDLDLIGEDGPDEVWAAPGTPTGGARTP